MKPKLQPQSPARSPEQENRVAAALRENLRKRKQQQHIREALTADKPSKD